MSICSGGSLFLYNQYSVYIKSHDIPLYDFPSNSFQCACSITPQSGTSGTVIVKALVLELEEGNCSQQLTFHSATQIDVNFCSPLNQTSYIIRSYNLQDNPTITFRRTYQRDNSNGKFTLQLTGKLTVVAFFWTHRVVSRVYCQISCKLLFKLIFNNIT